MKKPSRFIVINVVQGRYEGPHGWEDLCCDIDRKAARAELRNYDQNEPNPHRLIRRRVKREDYETGKF